MVYTRYWLALVFATLALPSNVIADEPEWGDLKLQFVVQGEAPPQEFIDVTKDQATCGRKLPSESFVVSKAGGVQNVLCFLTLQKGEKAVIHPDFDKPEVKEKEVVLAMKNCRIEPHVAVARLGQTLVVNNEDAVGHNVQASFLSAPMIPAGRQLLRVDLLKEKPSKITLPIVCSIHPWESAFLLVVDHPYAAASDADGKIVLKNLPVGKHQFRFWQESLKEMVAKDAEGKELRSKFTFEIKPGENDLGVLKISPPKG